MLQLPAFSLVCQFCVYKNPSYRRTLKCMCPWRGRGQQNPRHATGWILSCWCWVWWERLWPSDASQYSENIPCEAVKYWSRAPVPPYRCGAGASLAAFLLASSLPHSPSPMLWRLFRISLWGSAAAGGGGGSPIVDPYPPLLHSQKCFPSHEEDNLGKLLAFIFYKFMCSQKTWLGLSPH